MKAGAQIGNNIIRSLQNKKLKEYKFTGLGDACSLARRRAVGHLYGIQVTGFIAWLAWRLFMVAYLPIIDRRVRTIFDWLAWPIIGRDVVSIKANHKLQVKELYFEPGQVVIQQGDAGNGMFLISSGEVDVIKDGNQVATLKKGEHFGEIAVFENCKRTATIISKTRIKLLEIKRDAAMLLKDSINTQKI
jgi:NADH dehydrogenase